MLEKLFVSKIRVRLLIHFLFSKEKLRLRELARKLKLPVSAVFRELNNLLELSIIIKEKDCFVVNKDCNFLLELKSLFLKTDAFNCEFENALRKKAVNFAFIFGSFANEKVSAESDIDLFVVGKITNEEIFKIIKPLESRLQREINPLVWSLEELKKKKKGSFIRDIFKKEIIIIRGKEDELRKIIK